MSYVWVEECFCEGALQFRVAWRETRVTALGIRFRRNSGNKTTVGTRR